MVRTFHPSWANGLKPQTAVAPLLLVVTCLSVALIDRSADASQIPWLYEEPTFDDGVIILATKPASVATRDAWGWLRQVPRADGIGTDDSTQSWRPSNGAPVPSEEDFLLPPLDMEQADEAILAEIAEIRRRLGLELFDNWEIETPPIPQTPRISESPSDPLIDEFNPFVEPPYIEPQTDPNFDHALRSHVSRSRRHLILDPRGFVVEEHEPRRFTYETVPATYWESAPRRAASLLIHYAADSIEPSIQRRGQSVDRLREIGRDLDAMAEIEEDAGRYDEADRLRALADDIRRESRLLKHSPASRTPSLRR